MIIAVGGLGGSGTRAVAQILIESGIYLGDNLNGPKDNLLFTSLFKNPKWFKKASKEDKLYRLDLFEKYMINNRLSLNEKMEIINASYTNPFYQSRSKFNLKLLFWNNQSKNKADKLWGWKEPNTYLYIDEIATFFQDLKYIHVIRNGLDMAFSKNMQQLNNWGFKFNITINPTDDEAIIAKKQLEYWIKANKYVRETGKRLLSNNLYLLNHDKLCTQPEVEIRSLFKFLKLELNDELNLKLKMIPKSTSSNNRYLKKDISIFTTEQIKAVEDFGFRIYNR